MLKREMAVLAMLASLGVSAHADTVLGLTLTADVWHMDSSGSIADTSDLQKFDFGAETTSNFSLALEHPIPLIPNLKMRITDLSSSGDASLSKNFTFEGVTYPLSTAVDVNFDLRSSDFIFYYELLDNDAVSFDLGLNAKYLDGDLSVSDGSQKTSRSFKGVVPMLYGAVKVWIPATSFSLFGDISFLSVGDHTLRDFQAGAAYTLVENPAVDFSVRGGYRQFSLELDNLDDIYSDWTYDGLFLGVEADF
jgi:outer membrane protein